MCGWYSEAENVLLTVLMRIINSKSYDKLVNESDAKIV